MGEKDLQHWVDATRRGGFRATNERFPENPRFLRRGIELLDQLRIQSALPEPRLVSGSEDGNPFPGVDCEIISRPAGSRPIVENFAPVPADRYAPKLAVIGTAVAAVLFLGVLGMLFSGGSDSRPIAKQPLTTPEPTVIETPTGDVLATSGGAEVE